MLKIFMLEINLRICTRSVLIYKELGETTLFIGNPRGRWPVKSPSAKISELYYISWHTSNFEAWGSYCACFWMTMEHRTCIGTQGTWNPRAQRIWIQTIIPLNSFVWLISMGDKSIHGPLLIRGSKYSYGRREQGLRWYVCVFVFVCLCVSLCLCLCLCLCVCVCMCESPIFLWMSSSALILSVISIRFCLVATFWIRKWQMAARHLEREGPWDVMAKDSSYAPTTSTAGKAEVGDKRRRISQWDKQKYIRPAKGQSWIETKKIWRCELWIINHMLHQHET